MRLFTTAVRSDAIVASGRFTGTLTTSVVPLSLSTEHNVRGVRIRQLAALFGVDTAAGNRMLAIDGTALLVVFYSDSAGADEVGTIFLKAPAWPSAPVSFAFGVGYGGQVHPPFEIAPGDNLSNTIIASVAGQLQYDARNTDGAAPHTLNAALEIIFDY